MSKMENTMRYGCGFLMAWPILLTIKTTLFWLVWNLTYTNIPMITDKISWIGSLSICLLLQILRIGLHVNFNKNGSQN